MEVEILGIPGHIVFHPSTNVKDPSQVIVELSLPLSLSISPKIFGLL
jgi:hypothetical protein